MAMQGSYAVKTRNDSAGKCSSGQRLGDSVSVRFQITLVLRAAATTS
jgi:hypothetical protein